MIQISGLETLTTSYCITSSTVDDINSLNDAYTTATTSLTTTATLTSPHIQIDTANHYVDSLSIEQLAELDQKIQAKEMELEGMTIEFPSEDEHKSILVKKTIEDPKVYKKV